MWSIALRWIPSSSPGFLFVLGCHEPFIGAWPLHADERAKFRPIAERMISWFLSAGVAAALWSVAWQVSH